MHILPDTLVYYRGSLVSQCFIHGPYYTYVSLKIWYNIIPKFQISKGLTGSLKLYSSLLCVIGLIQPFFSTDRISVPFATSVAIFVFFVYLTNKVNDFEHG